MSECAYHPEALRDLEEIWDYIAADSLDAADRMVGEVLAAVNSLGTAPHQGRRRPELTSLSLRFLLVREYLIAYAPDDRPLCVLAVIHGRRSPRLMAAILRSRL